MINEKALINLKKAKSHIEKIIKMMEGGEYCINIMQQNLAVIGLLKSAHWQILDNHLQSCFVSAIASRDEKKKAKMLAEIMQVTKLYNK